jgi:hypothetical protein
MATTYEIHPAIGVARVGSSRLNTEEGYFISPEPDVPPPAAYRDPMGGLKRQAARFRVFECRRDDRKRLLDAVELTTDSVRSITWTAHLANRKGAARKMYGYNPGFRNKATGCDERDRDLIIDPGPRSVGDPGERRYFDTGRFRTTPVPLGELFMEPGGRLVVLGGHGRAGSDPTRARLDVESGHFADNDDWYDDVSDGPVEAAVELRDGAVVRPAPAWVVVGPPDFAPGVANLVTLYDLLFDLAVRRGLLKSPADPPGRVSFPQHVRPILERSLGYRWVNRPAAFGYAGRGTGHAPGGSGDFSKIWSALGDPSPGSRALRTSLAGRLRNPDPRGPQPQLDPLGLIPRLSDHEWLGSGAGNVLALTYTQYAVMQAWARGEFDHAEREAEPLPDALDRTALEACVGGPLYPGIEASGCILAFPDRYMEGEPFRLSRDAVRPGDVTAYNGVPWQADFLYCRWEETQWGMPKRLGWWPAQRPDDVYKAVGDESMAPWARGIGADYQDMIDKWDRLGIVAQRGPSADPWFVEVERLLPE